MFEEVCDSVVGGGLISGSCVDPESNGGSGRPGVFRGNAHAIIKDCHLGRGNIEKTVFEGNRRAKTGRALEKV